MGKIRKHCIEKFYNKSGDSIKVSDIESRDPLMIKEEEGLFGFRFFDVLDDENGLITNYSGMYYFGQRISYKELTLETDLDFIAQLQLEYLNKFGLDEAIFCENTAKIITIIKDLDVTIDEVKVEELLKKASTIFISQQQFMSGLAKLLATYGNDVSVITSEEMIEICDRDYFLDDDSDVIVRTYDLYVDEYKNISVTGIVAGNKMGVVGQDTYFRLSDAIGVVRPLFQEYPFLEKAVQSLELSLINGSDNIEEPLVSKTMVKKS